MPPKKGSQRLDVSPLSPRSNSTAADPLQQILAATLATQRTVEALGERVAAIETGLGERPMNVVDLESDDRAQRMSWQASRLSFDATSSAPPRVPNSRVSFDDRSGGQRRSSNDWSCDEGAVTVPSVVAGAGDEGAALPAPTATAAPAPAATDADSPPGCTVRQLGDGGSVEVVRGSSSPAPPETTAVEEFAARATDTTDVESEHEAPSRRGSTESQRRSSS